MGPGSTEEVVDRCARVAEAVDALAARVRGTPPGSWTGPAADELAAGVRHAVRLLDDGGAAVHRAAAVARHVGVG